MGCSGWFSKCATGEALHDAEILSPLVGLDDGVTLVFLGNDDGKGNLSGGIVQVATEELNAYQGSNKIESNQFGGLDLSDARVAALEQVRPVMIRGMGMGDRAPDAFRDQITQESANNLFDQGIESLEYLVSKGAQRHNDARDVEADAVNADGNVTQYEALILGTYESDALSANNALDTLRMVDNMPDYAPLLIEAINDHDNITPEQKELLVGDITMGGADAGIVYQQEPLTPSQ